MHLFFKLVKQLKEPNLSKIEWEQLSQLYIESGKKTADTIGPLIKDKQLITFKYESAESVLMFIQCWLVLTDTLSELNNLIEKSKNIVCDSDMQLHEDDKKIIMYQLLPNDLEALKKAMRMMQLFSRMDVEMSATNQLLRNFLFILSLRIHQLENRPTPPLQQSLSFEQLTAIYIETCNQVFINKLLLCSRRYKQDIELNAEKYLKETDELGHFYCKNYCENSAEFLMLEIEIQQLGLEAEHAVLTPLFKLFLTKFSQLHDLIKTLTDNKRDTRQKLVSFAQKFEVYRETFRHKCRDNYVFFKTVYADETLELEFIKTCDAIASQVMSHHKTTQTKGL